MSGRAFLDALNAAGVFAMPAFLDSRTCRFLQRKMDEGTVEAAEVLDRGLERDVRRASNVDLDAASIELVERRLDGARGGIGTFFGLPLDEREGASFLRYRAGDFYKPHRDRSDTADWAGAARRQVAVVVFLNSSRAVDAGGDFDGGVLQLFVDAEPIDVASRRGLLVAFPADALHQVTRVTGGTRDTIVDWFYR